MKRASIISVIALSLAVTAAQAQTSPGPSGTPAASIVNHGSSNFTVLDAKGNVFGGTNDVYINWDGLYDTSETDTTSHMTIETSGPTPFFGAIWYAHDIQVFGPGTYYFETDNTKCESKKNYDTGFVKTYHASATDIAKAGCPGTPNGATTMEMIVRPGQVGAHMLLDYDGYYDIDVINVWDQNAMWIDPTGQGDGFDDLYTGLNGAPPSLTLPWALVSTPADASANNGGIINGSPMIDGPFKGFYVNFNYDQTTFVDCFSSCPDSKSIAPTTSNHNFMGGLSWQTLLLTLSSLFGLRRCPRHYVITKT